MKNALCNPWFAGTILLSPLILAALLAMADDFNKKGLVGVLTFLGQILWALAAPIIVMGVLVFIGIGMSGGRR